MTSQSAFFKKSLTTQVKIHSADGLYAQLFQTMLKPSAQPLKIKASDLALRDLRTVLPTMSAQKLDLIIQQVNQGLVSFNQAVDLPEAAARFIDELLLQQSASLRNERSDLSGTVLNQYQQALSTLCETVRTRTSHTRAAVLHSTAEAIATHGILPLPKPPHHSSGSAVVMEKPLSAMSSRRSSNR